MTVSRLVYFALPDKQIWGLKATWLTKFFVWLDILSFLVQAAGGIMMSRDGKNIAQTGKTIYMVGVGIQIAFIVVFGVLTSSFYRKAGKAYLERNISLVKHQVWAMYIVLVLIMVSWAFSNSWLRCIVLSSLMTNTLDVLGPLYLPPGGIQCWSIR